MPEVVAVTVPVSRPLRHEQYKLTCTEMKMAYAWGLDGSVVLFPLPVRSRKIAKL
jgi:hypothetical protein